MADLDGGDPPAEIVERSAQGILGCHAAGRPPPDVADALHPMGALIA